MTHSPAAVDRPATPPARSPQPRFALRRMLRQSWLVAAGAVLGVVAAMAFTSAATPEYTSRASLQLSLAYSSSATDINQGAAYTRSEMLSYAELATSTTILQPVVRELGLTISPAALAGRLAVTTPPNTSVLHIAATDTSPRAAASIANAVAGSLSSYAVAHSPADDELGPLLTVTTIASASPPSSPSSPRLQVNLAAGLLLGLLAGVLAAMVRLRADTRLRTVADIAALTDAPVLGTLARRRPDHASQGVRLLAAALRHSLASDPSAALIVTPAARRAEVSGLTDELASTLTAIGLPAAAMVGDLGHRGTQAHTPDDAPALESFRAGLSKRQEEVDTVLVSAPSIAASADAAILGAFASGALVVVHAGAVRAEHLHAALQQLSAAGLPTRGIILDEARMSSAGTSEHGHSRAGLAARLRARMSTPRAKGGKAPVQSLQRG
ncbi:hypothetical protein FVA74_02100 [Salinibacterium sp. dk2585]|uniref:YveK family protein n=1 Tax=unclassified Salinibacterium TaxID=2632331 RepID=UPI0011C256E4|nr:MULTISPECIES: Wzz/FepE/Etk N-terminal domain-containing protein [unclassified Salinibacterium]QEE60496.1 hypothetical protein FVA74_02100 [Salinibacterium sp. dk2585]TXK55568.1 hypothetical protein FVP63_02245 [Salinibacterium sp. dk5596]